MKKTGIVLVSAVSLLFAASVYSQQCGSGNIVELKEGGWNSDDFMIRLEGPNAEVATRFHGFVRFSATNLSSARLDAIRRLATSAFALDAKVWTYSHTGSCSSATELSMLR